MQEARSLAKQLKPVLGWNQARIMLISYFIIGVIKTGTVNLTRIAVTFGGRAQPSSNYKRLQRFFRHFDVDLDTIAQVLMKWSDLDKSWLLCLDRTNWKFGRININLLVLSVAYKGVAIPILWNLLDKKGMSNTGERKALLDRFIRLFGHERIQCLTADREFRGKDWLQYLKEQQIPYCIRIPNNTKVNNKHCNAQLPVYRLFSLKKGEQMVINHSRKIWGQKVYLACFQSEQERVIVICNHLPEQALTNYQRRWTIETLFQSLKGRGFNLEDTHLQDRERISRLFSLLALAFCWSYKTGCWRHEKQPIKLKKHGRPAYSYFRYGFDWLRYLLFNSTSHFQEIQDLITTLLAPNSIAEHPIVEGVI